MLGDHFAWHWVNCRFTDGQYQARPGDGAHALACYKVNAGLGGEPNERVQQRTVGDVRVIACILNGAGFGPGVSQATELKAHLDFFALGQGDFHGVVADAAQQ